MGGMRRGGGVSGPVAAARASAAAGAGAAGERDRPALGILELSSIARGIVVSDAALKQAPSLLLVSRPVSGGKHLVIMRGDVAEIDESMRVARARAAERLVDSLELAHAAEPIWPILDRATQPATWPGNQPENASETGAGTPPAAVVIVETATVCAAVDAIDAAAKAVPVVLGDVRLAVGIAGKAFFVMTGELADIEAAADAARARAGDRTVAIEIIASPTIELAKQLLF